MKRTHYTKAVLLLSTLVAMSAAVAADLKNVRTVCDEAVAARTNMKCTAADAGTLTVSHDAAVAARTNMPPRDDSRQAVTVTQDAAVLARTNVGDIARQPEAGAQGVARR